jgi:transposase-like protein
MLSGYSLEKCAKLTGISKQTSIYWRKKILTALSKFQKKQML